MQTNTHSLVKQGRKIKFSPSFKSIRHFLNKNAQKYGSKPAIIYEDFGLKKTIVISYEEFYFYTIILARSLLLKNNLTSGSSISFSLTNTPEVILLNYAAWSTGLVTVPLDPRRDTIDRKIFKLKLTNTKLLITQDDPQSKKDNKKIKKSVKGIKIIEISDFDDFKAKFIAGKTPIKKVENSNLAIDCLVLFTSGTTANPKGVRLSLTNLFANADSVSDWLKFNNKDRFYVFLPLHHINATTFVNATFLSGGTLILSSRYSKSRFWETIAKYSITGTSIVPTVAYDLLSEEKSFKEYRKKLKRVKGFQIGSAPVQPLVVEKFIKRYNIPLYQGYGQTETSLRSTGVPLTLSAKKFKRIRELNSVGCELKNTNVSILNEKGQPAKEGEIGEICVRGPSVMKGYLQDKIATKEAFEHNWFHSGDMGYFKILYGVKFFFLTGRRKEIIKKGAYLISPLAIENILLRNYPSLRKVYAVGFPDPRSGQEIGIVAVAKKKGVIEKILDDAKEGNIKGLPEYELPRAALVVKDSELPKTSTGKIQRVKIREIFGPLLLAKYRTIAATNKYSFRIIGPEEKKIIKQAVKVNNSRWGKHLQSNKKEFGLRAQNGILIGAFDGSQVIGTISALQINDGAFSKIGEKGHWTNTWNGITGNGTLSPHNPKENSLVCIAISTKLRTYSKKYKISKIKKLNAKILDNYLKTNEDTVVRFHRNPKAGLKIGAKIVKVIPNGHPKDKEALGYNLLMKYLTLKRLPNIDRGASIGTQLIEAVLIYAFQNSLKHVYVYTRPADLNKHFK